MSEERALEAAKRLADKAIMAGLTSRDVENLWESKDSPVDDGGYIDRGTRGNDACAKGQGGTAC